MASQRDNSPRTRMAARAALEIQPFIPTDDDVAALTAADLAALSASNYSIGVIYNAIAYLRRNAAPDSAPLLSVPGEGYRYSYGQGPNSRHHHRSKEYIVTLMETTRDLMARYLVGLGSACPPAVRTLHLDTYDHLINQVQLITVENMTPAPTST